MRKKVFAGIFVAILMMVVWIPVTTAQEEPIDIIVSADDLTAESEISALSTSQSLSGGCAFANLPERDGDYSATFMQNFTWNAGETLTTTVTISGSGKMRIVDQGTTVATGSRPGTLTYTFPSTGRRSSVSWQAFDPRVNVKWRVSCGVEPPPPPPNDPPVCSAAIASVDFLWPPEHQMVAVSVNGVTDPDGDPVTISIDSIFQDEPTNGLGDGDTSPDGQGVGTSTASIRAERAGDGNGRTYHIGFTASDGQGGTCSGQVLVGVNHDQGKKGGAVDDGALYNSTTP